MKGCREYKIAFLCMHYERIQQPILYMTSIDEDMLEDIEWQKKLEDQYNDTKAASDPPSLTLNEANLTKSISTFEGNLQGRRGIMVHPLS